MSGRRSTRKRAPVAAVQNFLSTTKALRNARAATAKQTRMIRNLSKNMNSLISKGNTLKKVNAVPIKNMSYNPFTMKAASFNLSAAQKKLNDAKKSSKNTEMALNNLAAALSKTKLG